MSKCHVCGATSFRKVIERDPSGAMSHLGRFACDGCGMVFTDRQVWSGVVRVADASTLPGASTASPRRASELD